MIKEVKHLWLCLLAAPLCGFLLGCGPSSGVKPDEVSEPAVTASGSLSVYLVKDGLAPEFSQMNLVITGLELQVGGVWRPVPLDPPEVAGAAGTAFDLLSLTSEQPRLLATKVPWPEGENRKVRLTFGAGHSVQLAEDSSSHELVVQKVIVAGLGLPGSFIVAPKAHKDLWLAMDVRGATPLTEGGDYGLKLGALRGYDKSATGSIKGSVAERASADSENSVPEPLGGVIVTAQQLLPRDAGGAALAFRTVTTDREGGYVLDLLPLGYTWCVVSQPVLGERAYTAVVGAEIALGQAPYDQGTSHLLCSEAPATGVLEGEVARLLAAEESATVDLVKVLALDGLPYSFAVRTERVVTVNGKQSFTFSSVPPGAYYAVLNRTRYAVGSGNSTERYPTAEFEVGALDTVTIRF